MRTANKLDLDACAKIADEMLVHVGRKIDATHGSKKGIPVWANYTFHALLAIAAKDYGMEYPDMAILRVMDRLTGWRGPDATRLKQAMNDELKKVGIG